MKTGAFGSFEIYRYRVCRTNGWQENTMLKLEIPPHSFRLQFPLTAPPYSLFIFLFLFDTSVMSNPVEKPRQICIPVSIGLSNNVPGGRLCFNLSALSESVKTSV